jgi:cell division protein FtsB
MNNLLKHGATGSSALEQFLLAASLLLIFCFTANGQTVSVAQNKTDLQTNVAETRPNNETENRIKQLETEVQTMRAEMDALKKLLLQQQATQNLVKAELQTSEIVAVKTEDKTTEAVKTETKETIKTEPKQQTPPKQLGVDLGSVRLTPYGTIYFNAFNNTGSTNNQDVPLFATPFGQSGASASVRQTRLGLRFEGARIGNARLGGVLEADFFGGFPAVGIGENFGVVRLRLVNARLDWEKTSVTIGQDWMPFAPVNPTSIAAAAIPQLAAAGNPWARLPQVRVDHQITDKLTLTGAILAPQTGDHPPFSFFLQPTSGAASRLPFFQSRIAFADKNWLGTKKNGAIGVSGHYGRSRSGNTFFVFAEPNISYEVDSFGLAVDWNFPLHARVSLAGEAFFGRNLGGFQAGVFQGLNTEFAYRDNDLVTSPGIRGIGTRGGWAQLGFTPDVFKDRLTVYGSIGIDDPRNEDLTSFFIFSNPRSRNLAYAFNAIYKFTPQFQIGAEFRRFETQYFVIGERTNNHVNLGATYSF